MKTSRPLIIILALSLLTGCRRERQGPFEKEIYDYHCDIVMGHDTLISYSIYDDIRDTLISRTDYRYAGNHITETCSQPGGKRLYTKTYIMNSSGMAQESFDTLANGETRNIVYEHSASYIQKEHIHYRKTSGDTGSYSIWYYNFMTQVQISPYGTVQSCSDYYNLSGRTVKLNVMALADRFKQMMPDVLPSSRQYNVDCPQTPQSAPAQDDYQYQVDGKGYITILYNTYTPSFNVMKPKPKSVFKKTRYTYTIR